MPGARGRIRPIAPNTPRCTARVFPPIGRANRCERKARLRCGAMLPLLGEAVKSTGSRRPWPTAPEALAYAFRSRSSAPASTAPSPRSLRDFRGRRPGGQSCLSSDALLSGTPVDNRKSPGPMYTSPLTRVIIGDILTAVWGIDFRPYKHLCATPTERRALLPPDASSAQCFFAFLPRSVSATVRRVVEGFASDCSFWAGHAGDVGASRPALSERCPCYRLTHRALADFIHDPFLPRASVFVGSIAPGLTHGAGATPLPAAARGTPRSGNERGRTDTCTSRRSRLRMTVLGATD